MSNSECANVPSDIDNTKIATNSDASDTKISVNDEEITTSDVSWINLHNKCLLRSVYSLILLNSYGEFHFPHASLKSCQVWLCHFLFSIYMCVERFRCKTSFALSFWSSEDELKKIQKSNEICLIHQKSTPLFDTLVHLTLSPMEPNIRYRNPRLPFFLCLKGVVSVLLYTWQLLQTLSFNKYMRKTIMTYRNFSTTSLEWIQHAPLMEHVLLNSDFFVDLASLGDPWNFPFFHRLQLEVSQTFYSYFWDLRSTGAENFLIVGIFHFRLYKSSSLSI